MNSFRLQRETKRIVLLGGASLVALSLAAPAYAQQLETVVVTGQRAAIESAIKIKENADQIIDSVVADDAGKLPDRSITEVLQRVSGVTITRFNNLGNPDNYTVEGSGPTVRGLPGGGSTLNGREAFSANGGRQLLWGDVPSELMAAVDVYKTYTPDQIEGGMGGTINLRTHMPFDFDGLAVRGVVGTSYGDLIQQMRPRASLMASNRWNTKWGEMGLLLDVSYDDNSFRNDSIQVEPYYPHTDVPDETGVHYIPGGFDFHTSYIFHKRGGVYEAFQWRPTDNLMIYQTAFISQNHSREYTYRFFDDTHSKTQISNRTGGDWSVPKHEWDASGNLLYTEALFDKEFNPWASWQPLWNECVDPNKQCSRAKTSTTANEGESRTMDFAVGAEWTPTDNWHVTGAIQFERSTSHEKSLEVGTDVMLPPFGLDLRGTFPVVMTSRIDAFAIPNNYLWSYSMDHKSKNNGQLLSGNIDAEYTLGTGFFKSLKFGVRAAARQEMDRGSDWSWSGISPFYMDYSGGSTFKRFSNNPADVSFITFPDYFRGAANLPAPMFFPNRQRVETFDTAYFHTQYGYAGDNTKPVEFKPYNITHGGVTNVAAYAMARFGESDFYGWSVDGNAGVRLVYNDNHSSGFYSQPAGTQYRFNAGDELYTTGSISIPHSGGRETWTPLPAFNVRFQPNNFHVQDGDRIYFRIAGSQSMEQPGFGSMNASGQLWMDTDSSLVTRFKISGGVADLKPQISRNLDLSLEWYGQGGAAFHVSAFNKWIADRMVYKNTVQNVEWNMGCPTSATSTSPCRNMTMEPTVISSLSNTNKETVIRGLEVGGTKYFDFLPERFRGFGAEANFTYISSKAPGDLSYDMFGNLISGLPVAGLSPYSYNATLMYDRNPFSVRLSYNWRSRYLISGNGWNTQGNYYGSDTGVSCLKNNYLVGGTGNNGVDGQCSFALPVYSKSFGSLDAGVEYQFDDHFSLNIQSQNLLNSVVKTTMGVGDRSTGRSWFIADRRISMDLRVNY